MRIVTLDFETFFSDDYTLKKMTTEEYIRDPQFEAHGAAVYEPPFDPVWLLPEQLKEQCEAWKAGDEQIALIAHHGHFDGFILNHHFDYRPDYWIDTLSMGRVVFDSSIRLGLGDLAERFDLSPKTVPYDLFKGKHWHELSPDVQKQVADGACHDCVLTRWIADYMINGGHPAVPYPFPASELPVVDATIRMFVEPSLVGDIDELAAAWVAEEEMKQDLFKRLGVTAKDLRRDDLFAQMLEELNVAPQLKTTAKGNEKYAFAKSDFFMQDLVNSEDPDVALLAEARLKAQSSIYSTRVERIGWASRRGLLPVYLAYAAAHTRRWGGGDKCVVADTKVLVFDIQKGVMEKRIVDVLLDDLVWDGEDFVAHEGVVFQGFAEVISYDGVEGTRDHRVWAENGVTTLEDAQKRGLRLERARKPSRQQIQCAREASVRMGTRGKTTLHESK